MNYSHKSSANRGRTTSGYLSKIHEHSHTFFNISGMTTTATYGSTVGPDSLTTIIVGWRTTGNERNNNSSTNKSRKSDDNTTDQKPHPSPITHTKNSAANSNNRNSALAVSDGNAAASADGTNIPNVAMKNSNTTLNNNSPATRNTNTTNQTLKYDSTDDETSNSSETTTTGIVDTDNNFKPTNDFLQIFQKPEGKNKI